MYMQALKTSSSPLCPPTYTLNQTLLHKPGPQNAGFAWHLHTQPNPGICSTHIKLSTPLQKFTLYLFIHPT